MADGTSVFRLLAAFPSDDPTTAGAVIAHSENGSVWIGRGVSQRCEWHDLISNMLSDEKHFPKNALGVCQMDGEFMVTEAYD